MSAPLELEAVDSKLRSAAAHLNVPYEVLKEIVSDPALQRFSSNREKRFAVYHAAAHAAGMVRSGPQNRWLPPDRARRTHTTSLCPQVGKGNRLDLGRDFEEAVRQLYPNPPGATYVGFQPSSQGLELD